MKKQRWKKAASLALVYLGKLAGALVVGALMAKVFCPLMVWYRGYDAFGGEWVVILGMAGLTYYLLSQVTYAYEQDCRVKEEKTCHNAAIAGKKSGF